MGIKISFIKICLLLLTALFIQLPTSHVCFSLPEPEEVVSGQADFYCPDPSTLHINAQDKAIVNYKSFDILENESVIINLPSANNEILNRVLGAKASEILGKLTSNGIVILINANGIFFGPNANVDVASLIASTRDITNSDFLSSHYVFNRLSEEQLASLLLNQGSINIQRGGFGVLIAGAIENQGTIAAPLGTIALAGGDLVTLDISSDGLISVAVDQATASTILDQAGNPITAQLKNTGTLQADGGVVLLEAESLPGVFEKAINLEGYVKADRLEEKDGVVKIVSGGDILINGQVSAANIIIGKEGEIVPKSVLMQAGTLNAASLVSVVAEQMSLTSLAPLTRITKPGGMDFTAASDLGDLITLQGPGVNITYLKNSNLALETDMAVNTSAGVIIQANEVKVTAKQFGTPDIPLTIKANITHINRIQGAIEIMESQGIGTSIMLRGPPDGFGAIIYNANTNLTLEANQVTLVGNNPIHLYGNITFSNLSIAVTDKEIYFEADKVYIILGDYTQSAGIVNASSSIIVCKSDFSITGGIFNSDQSTLILDASEGDLNFIGGGYTFNNVIFENTSINRRVATLGAGDFTFNGNFYLLAVESGDIVVDASLNNPNITVKGNIGRMMGRNIALDATATLLRGDPFSSGAQYIYGGPEAINDNDASTGNGAFGYRYWIWWANTPIWQLQWSEPVDISQISIMWGEHTGYYGWWYYGYSGTLPTNFYFQYWDGNNWQMPPEWQLNNITNSYNTLYDYPLNNPITTDKIIVCVPDQVYFGPDVWNALVGIKEAQVYSEKITASAVINAGSGTWKISGSADFTRLTFNAETSTVIFNATTSDTTITSNAAVFNNLVFNGVGGEWKLQDALTVNGDLTLINGILNLNGRNLDLSANSTFTNDGILRLTGSESLNNFINDSDSGSVEYIGLDVYNNGLVAGDNYYDLIFSAIGTYRLGNALTINRKLSINSGTLDLNAQTLVLAEGASFSNQGTLKLTNNETLINFANDLDSGTVEYYGEGNYASLNAGSQYYSLSFSGTHTLQNSLGINSMLNITNSGTLDLNAQTLVLAEGASFSNQGTLKLTNNETLINFANDLDSGTVEYYGEGNYASLNAGSQYYSLSFSGTHILDLDLSIKANFTNRGVLTCNSGTFTFNGSETGKTITSGSAVFNNIVFDSLKGEWKLQDALTVNGSFFQAENSTLIGDNIRIYAFNGITINGTLEAIGGWANYIYLDADYNRDGFGAFIQGAGARIETVSTGASNYIYITAGEGITINGTLRTTGTWSYRCGSYYNTWGYIYPNYIYLDADSNRNGRGSFSQGAGSVIETTCRDGGNYIYIFAGNGIDINGSIKTYGTEMSPIYLYADINGDGIGTFTQGVGSVIETEGTGCQNSISIAAGNGIHINGDIRVMGQGYRFYNPWYWWGWIVYPTSLVFDADSNRDGQGAFTQGAGSIIETVSSGQDNSISIYSGEGLSLSGLLKTNDFYLQSAGDLNVGELLLNIQPPSNILSVYSTSGNVTVNTPVSLNGALELGAVGGSVNITQDISAYRITAYAYNGITVAGALTATGSDYGYIYLNANSDRDATGAFIQSAGSIIQTTGSGAYNYIQVLAGDGISIAGTMRTSGTDYGSISFDADWQFDYMYWYWGGGDVYHDGIGAFTQAQGSSITTGGMGVNNYISIFGAESVTLNSVATTGTYNDYIRIYTYGDIDLNADLFFDHGIYLYADYDRNGVGSLNLNGHSLIVNNYLNDACFQSAGDINLGDFGLNMLPADTLSLYSTVGSVTVDLPVNLSRLLSLWAADNLNVQADLSFNQAVYLYADYDRNGTGILSLSSHNLNVNNYLSEAYLQSASNLNLSAIALNLQPANILQLYSTNGSVILDTPLSLSGELQLYAVNGSVDILQDASASRITAYADSGITVDGALTATGFDWGYISLNTDWNNDGVGAFSQGRDSVIATTGSGVYNCITIVAGDGITVGGTLRTSGTDWGAIYLEADSNRVDGWDDNGYTHWFRWDGIGAFSQGAGSVIETTGSGSYNYIQILAGDGITVDGTLRTRGTDYSSINFDADSRVYARGGWSSYRSWRDGIGAFSQGAASVIETAGSGSYNYIQVLAGNGITVAGALRTNGTDYGYITFDADSPTDHCWSGGYTWWNSDSRDGIGALAQGAGSVIEAGGSGSYNYIQILAGDGITVDGTLRTRGTDYGYISLDADSSIYYVNMSGGYYWGTIDSRDGIGALAQGAGSVIEAGGSGSYNYIQVLAGNGITVEGTLRTSGTDYGYISLDADYYIYSGISSLGGGWWAGGYGPPNGIGALAQGAASVIETSGSGSYNYISISAGNGITLAGSLTTQGTDYGFISLDADINRDNVGGFSSSTIATEGTGAYNYINIYSGEDISLYGGLTTSGTYANYIQIYGNRGFNLGADLTLTQDLTVNGNLNINSGTLDLNGHNLSLGGTFTNNGTLKLLGSENLTGLTNDTDSGSVEYTGSSAYNLIAGDTYYNLVISGSGAFTAGSSLVVNNNFSQSNGTVNAPAAGNFYVAGDFSRTGGIFNHNNATVIFNGDRTSRLSGSTTFHNLSCTAAGKTIVFEAGSTQTISGTLVIAGQSGNLILLKSSVFGIRWNIVAQAEAEVSFVGLQDSCLIGRSIKPLNSVSLGNNANWLLGFIISGSVYSDRGASLVGAAKTIVLAVNGAIQDSTITDANSMYNFLSAQFSAGDAILVYISDDTLKGNTVTIASDKEISGLDIYGKTVIARHENQDPIGNAAFAKAKGFLNNPHILYSISSLILEPGIDFLVWQNSTYIPSNTLSCNDLVIQSGATYLNTADSVINLSGKIINSGILDAGPSTITLNGTSGQMVELNNCSTFNNLVLSGSVTYALSNDLTVNGNLEIANANTTLDLKGKSLKLAKGAVFSNRGTLKLFGSEFLDNFINDITSGTIEYTGSGTYTGLKAGNKYYNLTISGSGTFIADSTLDVNGNFVLKNGTFVASSGNFYVAGDFAHLGGVFKHNNGTVVFDDVTKTSNILGSNTFYNLVCTTGGKQLKFEAGKTQTIAGNLYLIGQTGDLIVLRSTIDGQYWDIVFVPQTGANRLIYYVDVSDAYNENNRVIVAHDSVNSGDNYRWVFTP